MPHRPPQPLGPWGAGRLMSTRPAASTGQPYCRPPESCGRSETRALEASLRFRKRKTTATGMATRECINLHHARCRQTHRSLTMMFTSSCSAEGVASNWSINLRSSSLAAYMHVHHQAADALLLRCGGKRRPPIPQAASHPQPLPLRHQRLYVEGFDSKQCGLHGLASEPFNDQ